MPFLCVHLFHLFQLGIYFLLFFLVLSTKVLLINTLLTKQHQKHNFYFYIQIKSLHKINLYEYTNSLEPYRKCIHTK